MAKLDKRGHEILDPTPIAMPVGFKVPESLESQIRRFVRRELSASAAELGAETFEEADDFDIEDDDGDPSSPWELNFDQERQPRKPAGDPPKDDYIHGKSPDRRRRNEEPRTDEFEDDSYGKGNAKDKAADRESDDDGRTKRKSQPVKTAAQRKAAE